MTAYKYVERKAENQINWAEVGQNFSNSLQAEVNTRQKKKAAIDQATRDYEKVLANTPTGEFGLANTFALDGAAKLQKQALMQNTLLKSGQLDPRQYTIMQQNLVDGTDQMFSLAETYQAEYTRKMEMMGDGVPAGERLSGLEADLMASVEGLGNLQNHQMTIDPNSGMIGVGNYDENGKLLNNTTAFALKNRLKSNTKEFDALGQAENWIKTLGTQKTAEFKNLGNKLTADILVKISDITSKESPSGNMSDLSDEALASMAAATGVDIADLKTLTLYKEAQMNYVKSQLSPEASGTNAASMLRDHVGGYETYIIGNGSNTQEAWDAMTDAEKDKKILVTTENGNPKFNLTDAQLEVAERAFQSQIDIGLDYSEEEEAVYRQREGKKDGWEPKDVRDDNKADEAKENIQRTWNSIKGQTAQERVASFESLIGTAEGKAAGLIGVNPSSDGLSIEFVYTDPVKNRRIDFTEDISDEDWAILGNEITGLDDPTKALNAGGFVKDEDGNSKPLNTNFGDSGANRQGNQGRFDTEVSTFIKAGFPKAKNGEPFLDQEQDEVTKALNDRYAKYGLKAKATGYGGGDNTQITIDGWKGNAEYPATFDLDSDIDRDNVAYEEEQRFEKWLTYVLKQTKQIENLAKDNKFTGGQGSYGPCVNGKKEELATGLQVNC